MGVGQGEFLAISLAALAKRENKWSARLGPTGGASLEVWLAAEICGANDNDNNRSIRGPAANLSAPLRAGGRFMRGAIVVARRSFAPNPTEPSRSVRSKVALGGRF